MPADRLFHPRAGQSVKVNGLTDFEFRVWVTYVLAADDFGVLRYWPFAFQGASESLAAKKPKQIMMALERIVSCGLVRSFRHQGQDYLFQHDWQYWQRVTYPRISNSPKPSPDSLLTCDEWTQLLFSIHPGGNGKKYPGSIKRIREDSRISPEPVWKDSEKSLATRESANGYRLSAIGSEEEEKKASAVCSSADLFDADPRYLAIYGVVCEIPPEQRTDAGDFHRSVEAGLRRAGLSVRREVEVPYLDGTTGRIDLVVDGGGRQIAIELDNRTGRGKSLIKLLRFDGGKVLVLRDGYDDPVPMSGLDMLVSCLPLPPALSGRLPRETIRLDETIQPYDELLTQLIGLYQPDRVTSGYRTETAFVEQFQKDTRKPAVVWAEMLDNLENQKRGHQWRVKGMVPYLEKWLRDGLWRQRHEVSPASVLVSDRTAGTLAAAAEILKGRAS
jgi:hypothetical protein